ncbi:hypothetical protein [Pontibacter roseus]|uniref:hypothetical protein n=1 Tax=Pontibacter roseus TaxID=336989 RepID=UPI00039C9ED2|nr:hypothetical protein [Pontibacter roseus]
MFGGKTGTGSLTVTIENGRDGELLWRFFKTMGDGIATSTDDLIERMIKRWREISLIQSRQ